MRKLLGNSCAKGCMIYFVALLGVAVLTGMGLGGLRGKFSTDVRNSEPVLSIQSAPAQPAPGGSNQNAASGEVAPTTAPAESALPPPPLAPVAEATQPVPGDAPTPGPQPAPAEGQQAQPQPQAQQPTQAQAQEGIIVGEASSPFYIVQPGDTIWSIAVSYNVDMDALRELNRLAGDIILPGQLLYLPQTAQQPSQPQQPQGQPAAPAHEQPASDVPTMPQTGINSKP